MSAAAEIGDMATLRREIDAIDADLVRLLARRASMIERAIELKPGEGLPARIDTRVRDVLEKVIARAHAEGLDTDLAERLWREMMEHFIAREEEVLGKGDAT
ncbi:MAG: isochorismate pyruvate lyase [Limimaricola cinnabarinus]|jgi:isochorismate pyruvate lyase|uniref:chorismate mutase n=1 Tax=Limimaricola cinnabarinus LL-001 TaxID=1337093 RepID=U2YPS3_9RHOB|nr:chorismate mutase [Limimaricola cinnabarinus]GAD57386.1 isochorismate pyruvate-lyase [Limimaricola cinnabarinus LL-001]